MRENKLICENRDLKNLFPYDIEWFLLQQSDYKFDMAELGVMFDYLIGFFNIQNLQSPIARGIFVLYLLLYLSMLYLLILIELQKLFLPSSMIVVRMNTVEGANLFAEKMRDMRAYLHFSNSFAIINDTGTNSDKNFSDNVTGWGGYEDLKNLSCLVIIVDKGRMGDTFPANSFKLFDIRSRYYSRVGDKSTLIQDCGRATGYVLFFPMRFVF